MIQSKNDRESFSFTYSADEQAELKQILKKYQPAAEDKMDKLRRLDEGVTKKATMISLAVGIIGALIMGFGMSLVMTNLGEELGIYGTAAMFAGVVTGIVGMIPVCIAYPLYNYVLKKERKKVAPEILSLTKELMK